MTPGIQCKLERAEKQFAELNSQFSRLTSEPFHSITHQVDVESGIKSVVFVPSALPVDWSIMIGEFIHNLRSTLDQAVYFLTEKEQGSPLDMTEFPIFRDSDLFHRTDKQGKPVKGGGLYKIRGLNARSRSFVEAVQPYNTDEPGNVSVLWFLQQLSNIDKHRTIHICQRHVAKGSYTFIRDVTFQSDSFEIKLPVGMLKERLIIAEWRPLSNVDEEPDINFEFAFDVAFDEPTADKLAGQKVLPICEAILKGVKKVIVGLDATR